MNKIYKLLSMVAASLLIAAQGNAQAINEGFESGITTLTTTSGWAMNNLSTPIGTLPTWTTNATAHTGTASAFANFNNVAGAATISNWLIAPTRTLTNGDIVSFWTRDASDTYADRLQVRFSVNGASTNVGTTNTSVGDFTTLVLDINPTLSTTGYPSVYTQYTFTVSGLAGPTSGRIAFRYFVTNGGPTGANSNAIYIDDFVYTPFGGPPDVTVGKGGEYTLIPLEQVTSMNLGTTISNVGSGAATDAQLKVNVYQASNLTTPILSVTSPTASIAGLGSASFTAGTFTPTLGSYVIKYISSCTGNAVTSADTSTYAFSVVNNFYARDNGIPAQGVGAPNTIRAIIGNNFTITKATTMDSVLFFCNPTATGLGDTIRVRISNTTAGVPSNTGYIGESLPYKFTAANSNTATVAPITLAVKNLSAGSLTLAPGTYFVGIEKYLTSDNYGLQCTNDIYTANTVYANINNGAYSPLNTLIAGFNYVPIIRPYLNTCSTFSSSITSATNVICNGGSTGAITVNAVGGTSPYTSLWSNGATVTAVSNLVAGVYTNTITDASGCISVKTATITQPTAITLSITPTNVLCNGGSTGALNASVAGGTPGYTYLCSNGATTTAVSNLVAGTYNYTVTDASGCSSTQNATITEPTAITLSITPTNVLCNGGNTGALNASVSGGTPGYTYLCSNGATNTAISNLIAGTYNYTVTDASGCSATQSAAITEPTAITLSITPTNVLCNGGNTGALNASVAGGTPGYTYLCSNGATNTAISNLIAGTYNYTVTDASGCSATQSTAITEPTTVNVSVSGNTTTCLGGTINLTVSGTGGTGILSYTWMPGNISASTYSATPTVNDSYTVMSLDANGCAGNTVITNVNVNGLPPVMAMTSNTLICVGEPATLSGMGAVTYTWSTSETTMNIVVNPTVTVTYTLMGTDANGCMNTTTIQQGVDLCTSITKLNNQLSVNSIYPNPTTGLFTIELNNAATVVITNALGQVVLNESLNFGNHNVTLINQNNGVYFVKISANGKQQVVKLIKQ